ncbi:MBL fold metallo-hydrolase [Mangrovicoccus algicola]|uniref:MBL fold metallo-hydrolase n=1 Tax=Mangrovicoccus algicola TaxID=2771008 RepID=A0A8J6YX19_9RHOB|nr:MBL fold metallo-hydrolase [Mangrovicoccus algicola]MBE3637849.1 MBL fold metallo-hydrolase [Mangrovicoccus algicola]
MTTFTRRQALTTAAAAPLAAAMPRMTMASAEMMGATMPAPYFRFRLGGFEVVTLLGGTTTRDNAHSIFGTNVPEPEFAEVSQANFIPADKAQFFFTPLLVNTGAELVLFDTGLSADGTTGALQAAGYTPDQIDKVVLTHMHGDHIGGLMAGEAPTFANAEHVAGTVENNYWAGAENEGYDSKVRPLAERFHFIDPGAAVVSGITAVEAYGHTPGHMGFMIENDGEQMMLFADTANHYVWSLGYPDWEVRFDMDKAQAAATRRRVMDMLATDRIPAVGYHMPFPALGHVARRGEGGFAWVPNSYQTWME